MPRTTDQRGRRIGGRCFADHGFVRRSNDRTDVKIPDETRQRVRSAAARIGYQPHGPARQLAAGAATSSHSCSARHAEQIAADAVLVETLRGLVGAARTQRVPGPRRAAGCERTRSEDSTRSCRAQHADGLVISGPRLDDPSLVALVDEDFPIVIQGAFPGLAVTSVDVDNDRGARGAVEHLLSSGTGASHA